MFTLVFWVCLLSPINDWTADKQTGVRCLSPQQQGKELSYPTLNQCRFVMKQMLTEMSTRKEIELMSRYMTPGKEETWQVEADCRVKILDEPLICRDCAT